MKTTDPVCKMTIEEEDAVATSSYKGKTYRFCSSHCKQSFDSSPESYLGASEYYGNKELTGVKVKAKWTCPMHPEIIKDAPASCPKCGMALVSAATENDGQIVLFSQEERGKGKGAPRISWPIR